MGAARTRAADEWLRRPVLSRIVRGLVFVGPVAVSLAITVTLSRLIPQSRGSLTVALWIGFILGGSLLTLVMFERAARRLLPLAALLNVSMLFPDKAPARFAIARKTGSPRDLRAQLERAKANGDLDEATRMQSVIELVLALSVHDRSTRGHSERVRVFTDLLADELKVDRAGRGRLRWAALLHDIGKLEVPTSILNKPGKPDADEWAVLHRHPAEGARLIEPLMPWLGEWGLAVAQHHERFDGTGYPNRLAGTHISLAARIVAVADAYEVMTAPRTYKKQMTVAAARQELTSVAGTQLDPAIVRAFLNISLGRVWRSVGFAAWIGELPAFGRLLAALGQLVTWGGAATATTATVLTLGGLAAGPSPSPSPPPGHGSPAVVAGTLLRPSPPPPSPSGDSGSSGVAQATASRGAAPASTPGGSTSSKPQPIPTSPSSTGGGPSTTPGPGPTPSPKPSPPPTPTPSPTPSPSSSPCPACTNTSPTCVTYCNGSHLIACVSYCLGDHDAACLSHCYGNDDTACLSHCIGLDHPLCVTSCESAPVDGVSIASTVQSRSPDAVLWRRR